jgi:uncharacterized delta-60 repeat protein
MKKKAAAQFVRRLAREDSLLAKTFGVGSSFSTRRSPASAGRRLVGEGGSLITALYALLVALLVCLPSTSRAQLADSFDPNANNDVRAFAVQADGKILVGGFFTSIGGQTRNRIALLNPDGSLDASFDPNANQGVFAVPVQADGKILVGGYFTSMGGQTRNGIARLNPDGSLDTSFDPNANSDVRPIAVQADGKILVGGSFSSIGGQTRKCIARLNPDGSLDATFDPNVTDTTGTGAVFAVAVQADGKILVGGVFTSIGGQTRNNIARLNPDGSLDAAFDPNANFFVEALAVQADGKILVGGLFSSIGGQTRNGIARLNSDGLLDASFDPNANGQVHALAVQADGKILVGGFISIGGQTFNGIARLNSDGSLDASFDPNANDFVFAVAVQADGKILVGGDFTSIGGQPRNRIARLTPTGCSVTSTVCGRIIVGTAPTDFTVNLSDPADPATVQATDFTVNGTPADNDIIINGDLSITFHFNTSPVVGGQNTMHIPAGAFNCGQGSVQEFTCTFFYRVPGATPPPRPRPTPHIRPTPP